MTKKRQQQIKNRDTILRGKRLVYNIAMQQKYERALKRLVKQMTDEVKIEITKLFKGVTSKEYFEQQKEAARVTVQDASLSSQARILMNALRGKFTQLFDTKSKTLAERMVSGAIKVSKASLYQSLKQLSGGLSLKTGVVPEGMEDVAKASIEENVSLIKSIPQEYLKNVTGSVMRSITTGNGLADLVPEINTFAGQTERRARNIALDQTRKAYNSINKQRMQKIGVKKFEWIHSGGGQRPRKSHQAMNGNIYSFDNLPIINQEQVNNGKAPERGIPGQAINCGCTMVPVIEFDDE